MGSWSTSASGNDAALDWLAELVESRGWAMVDEALSAVLGVGDDYLDEQTCQEAIAACEVVAWVLGQPGETDEDTDDLEEWIADQEMEPDTNRAKKAKRVLDRVFNEPSELREVWEESDDFEEWKKDLADLKDRLSKG